MRRVGFFALCVGAIVFLLGDSTAADPPKSYVFCGPSNEMTGADWTQPQKCCFVLFPNGSAGFSCDNLNIIIDLQNVKAKETEGGLSYLTCPSCVEL